MTRLASNIFRVVAFSHQPGMRRSAKVAHFGFVARRACFRSDIFGASNVRRRDDAAIRFKRAARQQDDGERGCSSDRPKQFLAFTVQPSGWPQDSHAPPVLSEASSVTTHLIGKNGVASSRLALRSMAALPVPYGARDIASAISRKVF